MSIEGRPRGARLAGGGARSAVRRDGPRVRRAALALLIGLPAFASAQDKVDAAAAQALSDKYFCSACHANERTLVGPAFAAIAKKYKGDPNASAELARKVKDGGVGVWGQVPMPPNPTVTAPEMQQLLAWILSFE
jgi:cytochrome c